MSDTATALNTDGRLGSGTVPAYHLKSDIAQFCLPAASRDSVAKYAYANSIFLSFLVIGVVGIAKTPVIVEKELPPVQDLVPVDYTPPPPEEQPQDQPERIEEMPAQAPPDAYTPVVVAPANANVAFAVPVEGPVMVAPTAQMASAPPSVLRRPPPPAVQATPQITRLSTSRANLGRFPTPPGSILSGVLRRGQKAYLEIELKVEADGTLTSVEIRKSSEIYELDQKIVQHVKRNWKFNPQSTAGWYWWPFECEMP